MAQRPVPSGDAKQTTTSFAIEEWGQPPYSHLNRYIAYGEVIAGVYVSTPTIEIKVMPLDDQAWFWTPEWQAKEREADEDLRLGRYTDFDNIDDFINSL
jgi:hypothetical protein